MDIKEWVKGKLNKKEDGHYYINDEWILWDWEEEVIPKGVELLCKKYKLKLKSFQVKMYYGSYYLINSFFI